MTTSRGANLAKRAPLALISCLFFSFAAGAFASQAADEVTPEVQRLYAEARSARQSGDDATAIAKYRAILKAAPHLAAAYNNLGMIYFNDHDYAHAAEVLKSGLAVKPDMATASAMLGLSYFQLGENEKAEPALKTALRANPNDDLVEMTLAKVLITNQKSADAVARLDSYLKRNPKNQEAWYLLGKTHMTLSEEALKKVNEIDPNSVVAHEIAGEIDASMHNYDLALVEFKKAVDMAPTSPGTHMHMGDAYWNIGKWQSAASEFRAELKNDPNNCMAHWRLSNAILEANDSNEEALAEANLSIDRCPTLMQARVDRARALIRLGKQQDALPDLMAAVKESPTEPSIHFLLGAVYRSQGKTAEAQQEMLTYGKLQREANAAVAGQANDVNAIKNSAQ